ncbi:MAG: alpha/beta fold hydrolase [Nitriliruptorales bacterium]
MIAQESTAGSGGVAPTDRAIGRYRKLEAALWSHYGLETTERYLDLETPAVRLRITEVGDGRPVLCVGGTGGTGPYWGALLRQVEGVRWFILDRPGFGLSDPLDWSRHDFSAAVASMQLGVLDALEIDRISVVGHSVGSLWALRLAQHHPSRVERLALIGGGPLFKEIEPPGFIRFLRTPVGALIVRIPQRRRMLEGMLRQIGHRRSLEAGLIPDVYLEWRMSLSNDTPTMRYERDLVKAIVSGSGFRPGILLRDDEIAHVHQPTLMVYGTADDVGNVDIWQRFVGLLPHGELHLLDQGGHIPWLDDPMDVGDRLHRFLNA